MLHTFCTAPVLRDQQERYRKTESRLKELSNQLDVVNSKFEEEQAKRQEMQRRAGYYQRASDRLKQTCSDLSRQVNIFAFSWVLRIAYVFYGHKMSLRIMVSLELPTSSERSQGSDSVQVKLSRSTVMFFHHLCIISSHLLLVRRISILTALQNITTPMSQ